MDKIFVDSKVRIPDDVADSANTIFDQLPGSKQKPWAREVLENIRKGPDLSMVWARFARWLCATEIFHHNFPYSSHTRPAAKRVANLYNKWILTKKCPSATQWVPARAAAASVLVWIAKIARRAESVRPKTAASVREFELLAGACYVAKAATEAAIAARLKGRSGSAAFAAGKASLSAGGLRADYASWNRQARYLVRVLGTAHQRDPWRKA